jgi:hypothetical protein
MEVQSEILIETSPETSPSVGDLSVAELDEKLEEAVKEHERSERLICDYLLEMRKRRGYEKFGFSDIYYYAEARFGFSVRKTRYLLGLAQQALVQGRLGWTKARRIARFATAEDEAMWLDSALSRRLTRLMSDSDVY